MKFIIDGEERVVVVDDYIPMKTNKAGDQYFSFCKSSKRQNEIWMCLIEKAVAKICGSYEASEGLHIEDAFQLLAGGPNITYPLKDFKMDIRRGKILGNERFDKFYKLLNEASKRKWVVTASTPVLPDEFSSQSEESQRWISIKGRGIKYNHTYTILEVKPVLLANDYQDIIAMFRNPSGKSSRGLQWYGDWGPECDLWSKDTKKQVGRDAKLISSSSFWMSLEDMYSQFESFTINQCEETFQRRVINADIYSQKLLNEREAKNRGVPISLFGTPWGIIQLRLRNHQNYMFLRLWQMNHMYVPMETDKKGKRKKNPYSKYPEI
jgi:calpain-15